MATTMTLKTIPKQGERKDTILVELNWLSDASGDSSSSTAQFNFMGKPISYYLQGRELVMAETSPGSVTPTSYTATVLNQYSQDLFGGGLATRSTTAAESEFCYDETVYGSRVIDGDLTLVIASGGNAKTGKLILTFE